MFGNDSGVVPVFSEVLSQDQTKIPRKHFFYLMVEHRRSKTQTECTPWKYVLSLWLRVRGPHFFFSFFLSRGWGVSLGDSLHLPSFAAPSFYCKLNTESNI